MKQFLQLLCSYPFQEMNRETLSEQIKVVQDWNKMVSLINEHGITALTAYNIKEAGLSEMVPEEAMRLFEDGQRQSMIRNAWLTERWKEVNKILTEAGIKHVLLKGMALEYSVYGGQGLRQMSDNDILVKREDALTAWNMLQKHGFVPEIIKSVLHRKIISETGKHFPTLTKEGYRVDIHLRLFKDPEANEELSGAIDNAMEIDIGGTKGYILQHDIHLKYLNEHLLQHLSEGDSQLRLYADMELVKPGSAPEIPEEFLVNPKQSGSAGQRRNAYRNTFFSVPSVYRLRFLAGDLFPSVTWIMKRHNCSKFIALFYYPRRMAKLLWLI